MFCGRADRAHWSKELFLVWRLDVWGSTEDGVGGLSPGGTWELAVLHTSKEMISLVKDHMKYHKDYLDSHETGTGSHQMVPGRYGLAGNHLLLWKFQDDGGRWRGLWVEAVWWGCYHLGAAHALWPLACHCRVPTQSSICGMPWQHGFLFFVHMTKPQPQLTILSTCIQWSFLSGKLGRYMSKNGELAKAPCSLRGCTSICRLYLFFILLYPVVTLKLGKRVTEIGF